MCFVRGRMVVAELRKAQSTSLHTRFVLHAQQQAEASRQAAASNSEQAGKLQHVDPKATMVEQGICNKVRPLNAYILHKWSDERAFAVCMLRAGFQHTCRGRRLA